MSKRKGRNDLQRRKKEKLIALLEKRASRPNVCAASDVVIGMGRRKSFLVDYMTFSPSGSEDVSGIEKGVFTCYMIRTGYDDLYSDESLNFIGEINYLVTTAEVYAQILDDEKLDNVNGILKTGSRKLQKHILSLNPESRYIVGEDVGIYVAVPDGVSLSVACSQPAEFDPDGEYNLICAIPCGHKTARRRGMTEMLYFMLRAHMLNAGSTSLQRNLTEIKDLQLNRRFSYDNKGRLLLDGEIVAFKRTKTRKMFNYLVQNRGRWVSNEELLNEIWGGPSDVNNASLRVSRSELVAILRKADCEELLSRERGWQGIFND